MAGTERRREIRRRRKRKENIDAIKAKLESKQAPAPSASDKVEIARKLRLMTPGAEELITRYKLEK